jgi:hypothetical protein
MLDCYQRPGLVRGGAAFYVESSHRTFSDFPLRFRLTRFRENRKWQPGIAGWTISSRLCWGRDTLNILDSRGKPIFAFENGTGKYGDGVYWAADSQRLVVVVQYKPIGLPPEQGLRGVTRQAFSRQAGTIKTIGTRISCPPRPAEK